MAGDEGIERILVISAHPDDVDFGTAGSVAVWTQQGIDVTYCMVSDGEAGGSDLAMPRTEMAAIRRSEQTAAAECVGVADVRFLGHPDGRIQPTLELRRDLSRVIRDVRPQRVVCQSPERNFRSVYASHPDHLATGEAALCAVYPDARNPFAHPELLDEGFEPWTVPEVWVMSGMAPDVHVDITEVIDRKIKALLCHASQISNPDAMDTLLREWGRGVATRMGLPEGSYAEGFQALATG